MRRWLIGCFAAMLLAACGGGAATPGPSVVGDGTTGGVCTLIGCTNSLIINLIGNAPSDYAVTIAATGGETISFACEAGQMVNYNSSEYGADNSQPGGRAASACEEQGFMVADFTPAEVTITVTWDGGSNTQTLQPEYQTLQPNGPNCPPTCQQALLGMELP